MHPFAGCAMFDFLIICAARLTYRFDNWRLFERSKGRAGWHALHYTVLQLKIYLVRLR